jgi:predicted DsbA family dithiol-disulfide isomerase
MSCSSSSTPRPRTLPPRHRSRPATTPTPAPAAAPTWSTPAAPRDAGPIEVEIWWDVVCPWSYLGVHRATTALARPVRDGTVRVTWRSYELDRTRPTTPGPNAVDDAAGRGATAGDVARTLADLEATAASEGLVVDLAGARPVRSFDAHRLAHHGEARGRGAAVRAGLLRAHHLEHRDVADPAVLLAIAVAAGLDGAEAAAVIAGSDHAIAVRADERRAAVLGIEVAPAVVVDGRRTLPGALPPALLHAAVRSASRRRRPPG